MGGFVYLVLWLISLYCLEGETFVNYWDEGKPLENQQKFAVKSQVFLKKRKIVCTKSNYGFNTTKYNSVDLNFTWHFIWRDYQDSKFQT